MKLYQVDGKFFDKKVDAKIYRDASKTTDCVHKGPDHRLYGVKGNPRTHSHNARSGGSGTGFPKKVK